MRIAITLRKKKPRFIRRDYTKRKNLGEKWRRPKGIDNKLRLNIKGHGKKISQGYRSAKIIRGLNRSGLKEVLINSPKDLLKIKENQIPLISKTVGSKKRVEIIKKAKELNLSIQNIKDTNSFLKQIEEKIVKKKELKKKLQDKKKKFVEEVEKKTKEPKEKPKDNEKERILKTKEPQKQGIPGQEVKKPTKQQKRTKIIGEEK